MTTSVDARTTVGDTARLAGAKQAARRMASMLHRVIASRPYLASRYLRAIGGLARRLPDSLNKRRVVNTLKATRWPDIILPDQTVRLGPTCDVRLVPHVGEFDFEALFFRELAYEHEVFALLESRLDRYDAIVEIGANVGIFTTYFAKARAGQLAIFAFEPSRRAFARLQENLALNRATGVQPFNMAVTDRVGPVAFFEPAGHLTNGSLKRDFAAIFSADIATSTVQAVDGRFLGDLLSPYQRPLIKIDVEGAEAQVLRGLAQVIATARPDLIIEVLDDSEDALNALEFIAGDYQLFNITDVGLVEKHRFEADSRHRDYLLVPHQAIRS